MWNVQPLLLISAGANFALAGIGSTDLNTVINIILSLLIAIDVHELGHAVVADRLGDDTPRSQGHLSLNPFRHMDQFGILMLFITAISGLGFTYGFTPVNERNLRRRGDWAPAVVALAGPAMNILLAVVLAVVLTQGLGISVVGDQIYSSSTGNQQLLDFVFTLFNINVFLAVFNLVPLPPLDGWGIVSSFFPAKVRYDLRTFVQYGPLILLVLIIFEPQIHFFSSCIDPATNWVETHLLLL
jgi:Zn-dependent protease